MKYNKIQLLFIKLFKPKWAGGLFLGTKPPCYIDNDRVDILKKKKEDCKDWELEVQKIYKNTIIF